MSVYQQYGLYIDPYNTLERLDEINKKINEMKNSEETDKNSDDLMTKMYFEQMLRGLYLNITHIR